MTDKEDCNPVGFVWVCLSVRGGANGQAGRSRAVAGLDGKRDGVSVSEHIVINIVK